MSHLLFGRSGSKEQPTSRGVAGLELGQADKESDCLKQDDGSHCFTVSLNVRANDSIKAIKALILRGDCFSMLSFGDGVTSVMKGKRR